MANCSDGSCVGYCASCTTGCGKDCGVACGASESGNYNEATGAVCTGGNVVGTYEAGTCWCGYSCSGKCGGNCSGDCKGSCGESNCSSCSSSCGGCAGNCSGGCQGCTGCTGSCTGSCSGWCKGGCASKCTGACGNVCNNSCNSVLAIEAYNHLKDVYDNDKLEWLEDVDIVRLLQLLQEEGRRRMTPEPYSYQLGYDNIPQNNQEKIDFRGEKDSFLIQEYPVQENGEYNFKLRGIFTDDELIKRIANLLSNNAKKSTSKKASESNYSEKDLGKEYIKKALEASVEMVPVNTTSEEAH